jgi:hypothetical protein
MRRDTLSSLSAIVDPPPPPVPGRYRVDPYATSRLVDGIERELGRATMIDEAIQLFEDQAAGYPGRLVVLRCRIPDQLCPMRRSDGKPRDLVI